MSLDKKENMDFNNFQVNPEQLTLGQVEFIQEETGLSIDELQEKFKGGTFTVHEIIIVLATQLSSFTPADPSVALAEVRAWRVTDLDISAQAD
jgi:hypothetical protein